MKEDSGHILCRGTGICRATWEGSDLPVNHRQAAGAPTREEMMLKNGTHFQRTSQAMLRAEICLKSEIAAEGF